MEDVKNELVFFSTKARVVCIFIDIMIVVAIGLCIYGAAVSPHNERFAVLMLLATLIIVLIIELIETIRALSERIIIDSKQVRYSCLKKKKTVELSDIKKILVINQKLRGHKIKDRIVFAESEYTSNHKELAQIIRDQAWISIEYTEVNLILARDNLPKMPIEIVDL